MNGDEFCRHVFHLAGKQLGAMVRTLLHPATPELEATALPIPAEGDIVDCACVGSVWKSFPLLRTGFLETVFLRSESYPGFTLRLLRPTVSAAIGAAFKGALDCCGTALPLNFADNAELLYECHSKPSESASASVGSLTSVTTSPSKLGRVTLAGQRASPAGASSRTATPRAAAEAGVSKTWLQWCLPACLMVGAAAVGFTLGRRSASKRP